MYVRDIYLPMYYDEIKVLGVCTRHISAYVCETHILPMYARDIFLFIRIVNRVTFPERLLQIIKITIHVSSILIFSWLT